MKRSALGIAKMGVKRLISMCALVGWRRPRGAGCRKMDDECVPRRRADARDGRAARAGRRLDVGRDERRRTVKQSALMGGPVAGLRADSRPCQGRQHRHVGGARRSSRTVVTFPPTSVEGGHGRLGPVHTTRSR